MTASRANILRFALAASLLSLGVVSCEEKPAETRLESVYPNGAGEAKPAGVSNDIPRQLWRVGSERWSHPFAIYSLGDSLAIVLDRAHPFMHLIDSRSGEYLFALNRDSSETEPQVAYRIAASPLNQNEFVGYDLIASTLTTYRIGNADDPLVILNTIRIGSYESIDSPVWHSDGRISVEPVRVNSLRTYVSPSGEFVAHTGVDLTTLAANWVPPAVWRDAMEGPSCAHPDRSRMARAFQSMGLVLVTDSVGNVVEGGNTETFLRPSFEVLTSGEVSFSSQGVDARMAYRSCGASKPSIFALFSGQRSAGRGSFRGGTPSATARQVHVYDWRGVLRGGFRLARESVWIDVTPDARRLIALESGSDALVVAYDIPRKYRR